MDENTIVILGILGNDKEIIPYRKELNKITGGITATILLQQFIYWWNKMEQKPFYKFIEPCGHQDYKKGDSWAEELGMSKYEFRSAYKKLEELKIVSKKTNAQRVTFYSLNTDILAKLIKSTYLSGQCQSSTSQKSTYLSGQCQLTSITETTAETTQSESPSENSDFPFFVEKYGEDEKSNHAGRPSLNQVREEASRLKIKISVAKEFWLHYESTGWRGVMDWIPKLRKWEMDEKKFNPKESSDEELPDIQPVVRPNNAQELKRYFKQMSDEHRNRVGIKLSENGVAVVPKWNGELVTQFDEYAIEKSTEEKVVKYFLDNFEKLEKRWTA